MTNAEAIRYLDGIKPVGIHMEKDIYMLRREALNMAIDALTATTWIPCAEEVPENYADVIFCDRQGTVFFGHYNKYCDYWCADFCDDRIKSVVAWMPKPESYHE